MRHKRFIHLALVFIAALLLLTISPMRTARAAPTATCTFTSIVGSVNWGTNASWVITGAGCPVTGTTFPGNTPGNTDNVVILSLSTVSLNVTPTNAIGTLTVNASATGSNGLTIAGTNTLTTGAITINAPLSNNSGTIAVGTGTLNAASVTLNGSNSSRLAVLSVSSGTINVTGNITSGGTVAQTRLTFSGSGVLNIGGNLGAIGTLAPSTGTVNFNGSGVQTVAASLPFNNLMVSSGATLIFPATNTPTVSGTMTNNGTVQQTRNVSNATVSFLTISTDKYRGVDITTTANLGSVTVRIRRVATQTCTTTGGTSPTYALRCYEITPTTSGAATVTLWALDSQRNGIPVANLVPYRYTGSTWTKLTGMVNGTGSNGYVFGRGNTTGFSAFLLGDTNLAPTAVSLNHISATAPSSWLLLSFVGFMLVLTGWQWHHRRQN